MQTSNTIINLREKVVNLIISPLIERNHSLQEMKPDEKSSLHTRPAFDHSQSLQVGTVALVKTLLTRLQTPLYVHKGKSIKSIKLIQRHKWQLQLQDAVHHRQSERTAYKP